MSPSAYRPIVMLDEVWKLYERTGWRQIMWKTSTFLHQERSTVDVIMNLKALVKEVVYRGEMLLAKSLDIANTLTWNCIREALVYH